MNIEVHIEALILDHCVPGERARIGEALRRELAKLIAARGLAASMSKETALSHVDAGSFDVGHRSHAQDTGERIARAVYGGLAHD